MMENRESRDLKSLPLDLLKEKMTELSENRFGQNSCMTGCMSSWREIMTK